MIVQLDWEKADALVASARHIVVLTHANPDGDAIGSLCGLALLLDGLGKTVICAVDGGTPDHLTFMPRTAQVKSSLNGVAPETVDLVVITDCSDERRIGEAGKTARTWNKPWINLDHHATNVLFADANIVRSNAASSTEVVVDWAERDGWHIAPEAAACLMTGLVTDTLCFRTNSTTAITLQRAQQLMTAGANLSDIVEHTVNRVPTAVLRLWGRVMPTVQIEDGVAWAKITLQADHETGAKGEDGGLVSLLLQADQARVTCLISEESDGACNVSLRAKPGYVVAEVARGLGGGGHILAAGATVRGTPDEVEARVIPLLKAAAQAQP